MVRRMTTPIYEYTPQVSASSLLQSDRDVGDGRRCGNQTLFCHESAEAGITAGIERRGAF